MPELVRILPMALGTKLTLKAACSLVSDGAIHVLVDPGCFATRAELERVLHARAGLVMDDLAIVFFTHLHFDHYNDLGFADVPSVVMPRREVEEVRALESLRSDPERFAARLEATHHLVAPIFMRQFLRLIDDPRYRLDSVSFRHRLSLAEPGDALTPRVRVVDLAGHSIGQLGLEALTEHGRTVVAADAALSAEDFEQTGLGHHLVIQDPHALLATRARLAQYDCIVPGHGAWFHPKTGQPVRPKELAHA